MKLRTRLVPLDSRTSVDYVYPETTVAFIEKRAADILAGWLREE